MLSSCVEWSKEKLRVGQKLKKLTGYVVLMLKDTVLHKIVLREDKISRFLVRPLLVSITTREFAHKNRPMRPKGSSISMSVPHVGPKMAKSYPNPQMECRKNTKNE